MAKNSLQRWLVGLGGLLLTSGYCFSLDMDDVNVGEMIGSIIRDSLQNQTSYPETNQIEEAFRGNASTDDEYSNETTSGLTTLPLHDMNQSIYRADSDRRETYSYSTVTLITSFSTKEGIDEGKYPIVNTSDDATSSFDERNETVPLTDTNQRIIVSSMETNLRFSTTENTLVGNYSFVDNASDTTSSFDDENETVPTTDIYQSMTASSSDANLRFSTTENTLVGNYSFVDNASDTTSSFDDENETVPTTDIYQSVTASSSDANLRFSSTENVTVDTNYAIVSTRSGATFSDESEETTLPAETAVYMTSTSKGNSENEPTPHPQKDKDQFPQTMSNLTEIVIPSNREPKEVGSDTKQSLTSYNTTENNYQLLDHAESDVKVRHGTIMINQSTNETPLQYDNQSRDKPEDHEIDIPSLSRQETLSLNGNKSDQKHGKDGTGQDLVNNCAKLQLEMRDVMLTYSLENIWRVSFHETQECLKQRLHRQYCKLEILPGCSDLFNDTNFVMEFMHINNKTILWYPGINCAENCNTTRNHVNACEDYLSKTEKNNSIDKDLKSLFKLALPRSHQIGNNSRAIGKLLIKLYLFNKTLLEECGGSIHDNSFDISLSNLTIIILGNTSSDKACKIYLTHLRNSNSSVGYECPIEDKFCITTFRLEYLQSGIIFITKDQATLDMNEKHTFILRHFAKIQRLKGGCKNPLAYKLHSRIIQKTFQHFHFCYGYLNNDTAFMTEEITNKDTLVAINVMVTKNHNILDPHSYLYINNNSMLQGLVFTNSSISLPVYQNLREISYTMLKNTSIFNILIFQNNGFNTNIIEKINATDTTFDDDNKNYFIRHNDERSIWSPLNWIIINNCSVSSDENSTQKELLLFLSNISELVLGKVCNENTEVLLTSIRRERVSFLNSKNTTRGCTDGGINKQTKSACTDLIRDGSDYETRFFHFLVYPKNMMKDSAVKKLFAHLDNQTLGIDIHYRYFKAFNSHPEVMFGTTFLETDDPSTLHKTATAEDNEETLRQTMQIFLLANMTENSKCLDDIRNERFSMQTSNKIGHPRYVIGPIAQAFSDSSCLSILPLNVYDDLKKSNESELIRVNKFWPVCMYNMLISWNSDKDVIIIPEWDYLSLWCKVGEIFLLGLCVIITAITILGNTLVIIVILRSGLLDSQCYKMYISLAIADLLQGVTGALLAVVDAFQLIFGSLTIYDLTENGSFAQFGTLESENVVTKNLRFKRYSWPMVSSIMMNISVISSLLTLAVLGITRLLMVHSKKLEDRYVKKALIFAWVISIFCSIMVNYRKGGFKFVGYFDPITKLTINIAGEGQSVSIAFFVILIIIAGAAGAIIVLATIASLILYNINEKEKQQELEIHDQLREERRYDVSMTFLLMVILFLISSSSALTALFTNAVSVHPIFHFVLWWIFMAAGSWNWILYCFRGQHFRKAARKIFVYEEKHCRPFAALRH